MKIAVALDSFKGSLSSTEVCNIIGSVLLKNYPDADITSIPVADGGEGTARHAMRRLQEADLLWDGPGCIVLENSKQEQSILELSAKLLEVDNG